MSRREFIFFLFGLAVVAWMIALALGVGIGAQVTIIAVALVSLGLGWVLGYESCHRRKHETER